MERNKADSQSMIWKKQTDAIVYNIYYELLLINCTTALWFTVIIHMILEVWIKAQNIFYN
jgi:hypothetical protein